MSARHSANSNSCLASRSRFCVCFCCNIGVALLYVLVVGVYVLGNIVCLCVCVYMVLLFIYMFYVSNVLSCVVVLHARIFDISGVVRLTIINLLLVRMFKPTSQLFMSLVVLIVSIILPNAH